MPTLPQMYSTVNAKTYYSRPSEIYSALAAAGFRVYTAVLKEFSGFFLKFDTTSVTLTPGTQEYSLPADLTQLVNIAERQTTSEQWAQLEPESIADAMDNTQSLVGWDYWQDDYGESDFQFYGPYLVGETQKITISPLIDVNRMVELAYTAKWLPIVNAKSTVMLPDEGTYAMQNYAIADILEGNDDSLAAKYEARADKDLAVFLTWVRNRQIVKQRGIVPYLDC